MKLIIVRCLASFIFSLCLMGFGSQSILAATLPPSINSGSQIQTQEINLALDGFLDSIPSDYYAIRTPEALKKQLSNENTVLIDVREIKEYQLGHIPEAINIPLRTLTKHLDQIPSDSRIIVYCSTGYRSAMAVMALNLLGYENVQGFPPSFTGWKAAGETIVRT